MSAVWVGLTAHGTELIASALNGCRYVELWQQMGHATYGYRPPTPSIVFPPVGSAKAADVINEIQLFQKHTADQPVLYHIFR